MFTPKTDIAILGAGAIGQSFAYQLRSNDSTPLLINRGNTQQNHQQTLTFKQGQSSTPYLCPLASVSQITAQQVSLAHVKLLIVTVKAYQVVDALRPLIAMLPPQCHILLMHNGLGPHEVVESQLQGRGLSLGTTSQGALLHNQWQVEKTGDGKTQIGHYVGPLMPNAIKSRLLSIANSQWCEPILPFLWQKLAVNVAINPLSAINLCCNGELIDEKYRSTINKLTEEVITVAAADGIELELTHLLERIYAVIDLTANNRSSMLQDISFERITEIDAINGYVAAKAKHYGLNANENDTMVARIRSLQNGYKQASK
ncbi:2-dehydropantoate 2-reductase [Shewanella sp. Scap07]|uniref:ketopantoate reductase family protein n=1 Tax=Shewanella sp. Scap07 TaxID=2589987 RepID=UPI0015C03CE8|nr:2-dehydropantoate 2-reductase [Shewanella sp. Scap07]QLE86433.1 2-dehydropantoate 2-reductase [Shewanella sp. Scap07]